MNRYRAEIDSVAVGVVVAQASAGGLARLARALGADLPEGARSVAASATILHRGAPERILALTEPTEAPALAARVEAALDEPSAIVANLTDAHAWARLHGPDATVVLAQGVALDLRESTFAARQVLLTTGFGIEIILHREAADAFRIGCRASHGEFLLARLRLAADPLQRAS